MSQLLCLEDVSIHFGAHKVLENISFSLDKGEFLCLAGENGAGKTTLVRVILGMIKPDQGRVIQSEDLIHAGIGYMSQQNVGNYDFPALVREIVASGCKTKRSFLGKEQKKKIDWALGLMGIETLKNRPYGLLSGGQQRRVLLSRALCSAQDMLVLDEPAAGLDPLASAEFYQLLEKLNREEKMTIVMVCHDVEQILRLSSRILHLQENRLVFLGSAEQYCKSPWGKRFEEAMLR